LFVLTALNQYVQHVSFKIKVDVSNVLG